MKTSKIITSVAAASLALILLETKQQTALADTNPALQEPAASSTTANHNEHGASQSQQTNLAVASSVSYPDQKDHAVATSDWTKVNVHMTLPSLKNGDAVSLKLTGDRANEYDFSHDPLAAAGFHESASSTGTKTDTPNGTYTYLADRDWTAGSTLSVGINVRYKDQVKQPTLSQLLTTVSVNNGPASSSSVDFLITPYREIIPANEVGKNISLDASSQGQSDPELGWGFYWNYNAQPTIVDQNGNISFKYFFDQQGNQKQTIAKNSDGKWAVAVYAVPDAYVKRADNTRYTVADPEFQAEVATNANYAKAYAEGLNDLFINSVNSDGKSISFQVDKNNPNYQKLVQALQKPHYIFIKTVAPNYKYGDVYYNYGQINNTPNLLEAWTGKNGGDVSSQAVTISQQTATIIEEIHYVDEKGQQLQTPKSLPQTSARNNVSFSLLGLLLSLLSLLGLTGLKKKN